MSVIDQTAKVVTLAIMGISMAHASNSYRTSIDGAVDPEKVPARSKYAPFVKSYQLNIRAHLLQVLSPGDDAILNSLSVEDEAAEVPETDSFNRSRLDLCARRGDMDPVQIAQEYEKIVARFYDRRVNRYLQGLDALTPAGRIVVNRFIEEEIVPNTKTEVVDLVGWATSDPEQYLASIEVECHVAETGEFPPGMQELIEATGREFEQEVKAEQEKRLKSLRENTSRDNHD